MPDDFTDFPKKRSPCESTTMWNPTTRSQRKCIASEPQPTARWVTQSGLSAAIHYCHRVQVRSARRKRRKDVSPTYSHILAKPKFTKSVKSSLNDLLKQMPQERRCPRHLDHRRLRQRPRLIPPRTRTFLTPHRSDPRLKNSCFFRW